jgi:addiction module HigA family antidote
MTAESLPPVHPGEVLLKEYLKPLGVSQNRLARDLGVPAQRINDIILKHRAVTVDTALRLARYFYTLPPSSCSISRCTTTWKWPVNPAWWRASIGMYGTGGQISRLANRLSMAFIGYIMNAKPNA